MANIYVRSTDGDDADNGSSWALAKATLVGALAIATNADTIWVSQNHAESQVTAMTLTFPTTPGLRVLCGNDVAEPPTALATTATISIGAGSVALNFGGGNAYIYGIIFSGGTNNSDVCDIVFGFSALSTGLIFDSCKFNIRSIASGARLLFGANSSSTNDDQLHQFINCVFKCSNTVQTLIIRHGRLEMINMTLDVTGANITTLFIGNNSTVTDIIIEASDLSGIAWTNLFDYSAASPGLFTIYNTKLPAGIAVTTGTNPGPGGTRVHMHNCDSGDTNYRFAEYSYEGSVVQETTIVRTGGASDGTTPISWKMVSSGGTKLWHPLVSPEIVIWNETTGAAKTATIEVVNDGTTFQDDEIWLEVQYLGTAGFPQGSKISDRMTDVLSTPANQTTSTEAWTTTGLTTPVKQKLAVTFTPQEKGYIHAKIMLAEPSKTIYIDPLLTIT